MAKKKESSNSVFSEPHFQEPPSFIPDQDKSPLESVWMEPLQSTTGAKKGKQLYRDWFLEQKSKQPLSKTWLRTILFSLLAGPLAIFTAFYTNHPGAGILLLVVAGPLIEEIGKVLLPLMVMEKNPAKFSSRTQLILCAVFGGLVFSAIENLLYLNVYIQNPSPELIRWRWTVCVFLHSGCSLVAGLGVSKSWKESVSKMQPPKFETAAPLMITAVVLHGCYNFLSLFMNTMFE